MRLNPRFKESLHNLAEVRTYCRIVTALARTIVVQGETDALYAAAEGGALAVDRS